MLDQIIFLDIDGVLNNHVTHENGYCGIDPVNCRIFNRILHETDAKIVISSAWRYLIWRGSMTVKGFENMLLSHGVDCHDRIIGLTCLDEEIEGRGRQIRHWLNENGGDRNYVVIDDLDDGISNEGLVFIQTDGRKGIGNILASRAIEILEGD